MQYNQRKNDYTTKKRANKSANTLGIHDTGVDRDSEMFIISVQLSKTWVEESLAMLYP